MAKVGFEGSGYGVVVARCIYRGVLVMRVNRLMSRSRVTYSEEGTHEETLRP